jgi:alkylation response protein AidB-like acyl-CoA dehydrogenase
MMVELISRADAALFTLFGYQDVVEAIARFGSEAQAMRLLPAYCRGDAKCAMVLTEPEAGSDLQAVRLSAVCDAHGQWRLRGVKRFISNGSAEILLVLARSEPEANNVFALSLFVAAADASVHVTRVEDKMGLHGSPTCELYFEDTPAQLLGKRRYGLIRYTMFCLQHARLSVAAQALGIAEAAYAEALAWAKQRRQFGTTIYEKAPVANLLIEMRVAIESCRTLLYAAAQWLDLRNQLELRIAELKAAAAPYAEQKRRFDQADGLVAMLSGLVKYVVSERANEVCYNAVQIHGGSGYMRETRACQLALDVRITSIYEGTSQIHVIGSTRGVFSDILGEFFDEQARRPRSGESLRLAERLLESRATFQTCLRTIKSRKDEFRELAAKELVDLYAQLYIGYLLLGEADQDHDRLWIARRFIVGAWAQAAARQRAILDELFADLGDRDRML